jgi:hypothetical protein
MRRYRMRVDSTFSRLTAEQRDKLDEWLFEERITYAEILPRIAKEFGITASRSALGRYCLVRQEERAMEDLAGADRTTKTVNGMPVKVANLRESSMKLIGRRLQLGAIQGAEVRDVASLAKVLLESERWEIQRERLALARERFQFDAAEAALAEIPRVSEMTEEEVKKEKARVQGIIRSIFGTDLPK